MPDRTAEAPRRPRRDGGATAGLDLPNFHDYSVWLTASASSRPGRSSGCAHAAVAFGTTPHERRTLCGCASNCTTRLHRASHRVAVALGRHDAAAAPARPGCSEAGVADRAARAVRPRIPAARRPGTRTAAAQAVDSGAGRPSPGRIHRSAPATGAPAPSRVACWFGRDAEVERTRRRLNARSRIVGRPANRA
jgi:hypothetical protein